MAFYKCYEGAIEPSGGGVEIGLIDCANRTDPDHDHLDFSIPVKKKPKKFILYRYNSKSPGSSGGNGMGCSNPQSMCVYDESISTTQYFVQTNDGTSSATGYSGYYNIGSTYDYTPIRSITDNTINFTLYTPYYNYQGEFIRKYGGIYRYIIFY